MVMEEGSYMSDDGKMFQVGKKSVAGDGACRPFYRSHRETVPDVASPARAHAGWTTVNFHGTGFAAPPVTIATIQVVNAP